MTDSQITSRTKEASFGYRLLRFAGRGFIYLILIIWGFIAVVPFLWMLSTSVMTLGEAVGGRYITQNKLLERFELTDEELNTPMEEAVPPFVREVEILTPSEYKMTAGEYADTEDAYLRVGNVVYRGGLVNYVASWRDAEFDEYVWNSIQITVITLSGELFFSILAAYAFARMKWPGRDLIFGLLLSTLMIPGMVTIIPNFITVTWIGRIGSEATGYAVWLTALAVLITLFVFTLNRVLTWFKAPEGEGSSFPDLILSLMGAGVAVFFSLRIIERIIVGAVEPVPWMNNWPALTVPFMGSIFSIFLLRQFFAQIPDDLFDAAQIDGAGHWKFLWTVVFPLSAAPILVITVLSFIGTWNALAWPLLVTNTPDWRPIAVGLFNYVDDEAGSIINLQMAGSVITIIPILILYFLTQRQFTESIARTGLKG